MYRGAYGQILTLTEIMGWTVTVCHNHYALKLMGRLFQTRRRGQVHSPNINSKDFRILDRVRQLVRVTKVLCLVIRPEHRGPLNSEMHHLTSTLYRGNLVTLL